PARRAAPPRPVSPPANFPARCRPPSQAGAAGPHERQSLDSPSLPRPRRAPDPHTRADAPPPARPSSPAVVAAAAPRLWADCPGPSTLDDLDALLEKLRHLRAPLGHAG